MFKVFILLIAVCCVQLCCSTSSQQRFCGSALDQVFVAVCPHGLKYKIQRNSGSLRNMLNVPMPFKRFPFLQEFEENNAENSLLRMRRSFLRPTGAYDECCVKGCSYNEIKGYCL